MNLSALLELADDFANLPGESRCILEAVAAGRPPLDRHLAAGDWVLESAADFLEELLDVVERSATRDEELLDAVDLAQGALDEVLRRAGLAPRARP